MQKKTIRLFALIAAVVAIGLWVIFQNNLIDFGSEDTASDKAEASAPASTPSAAPQAIPVRGMILRSGPLKDLITVNGATAPDEEVAVSSEVSGKIVRISFQEGTYVKKGQELVHLDNETLQAERKRLVVDKELAEKIAVRLRGLYEKEGVSLQEVEVAEAEVKKIEADIALLDARLEKTIIRAPFAGLLGLRQVSEGSYLSPGDPIVSLVKINPIRIEFAVPEKFGQTVKKGSSVDFTIDGVEGTRQAIVKARASSIDTETRTLQVLATASNAKGTILPGAFASVQLNLQQFESALLVPTESVIPELGGKKVFLYKSGVVESRPVATGIRQEAMIQITDGLMDGDTVITTGVLQIRPGAAVRLTNLEGQAL